MEGNHEIFSEYQKFRYMSEKLQPYSCSKLEVFWKEVFKASAKKNITRSEGDVLGLMPKSIDRKVKKNIVYKYCSQQQLNALH